MATASATAADNLMLTGMVQRCPDCAEERIFVVPDCGDCPGGSGDYCCTQCGAAVSLVSDELGSAPGPSARVA
ncbi:MAG: hypothetical protein ACRDOY_00705 [Nocardioidaceae bacterium]